MKTVEELEAELETVTRERDEARAEVDHWRVKAEAYGNMVFGCGPVLEAAGHPIDCSLPGGKVKGVRIAVEALVLERDDARSLLLQARDAVEHERDRLSDCEHDPAFCTCDEAAKASALLAKIDALNADRSEVRRLRAFERAEVDRLMHQLADATNESTHFQVMCKREGEEIERLARQVELLTDERDEARATIAQIRRVFGNALAFDDARGDVVKMAEIAYRGACDGDKAVGELQRAERERDEARAEVERLREECRLRKAERDQVERNGFAATKGLVDESERLRAKALAYDLAYRRGAEAMREACAQWVADYCSLGRAAAVRALPIPEEP